MGRWSSILLCLVTTLWFSSSSGQIFEDDENIMMLQSIMDGQDKMVKYLDDLQNKMEAMEETHSKAEETQLSILKTQRRAEETQQRMEEAQNSMRKVLQEQNQNILAVKKYIDDPVAVIIDLLGKNECQDGSHNCSSNAICVDKTIQYECQCFPGFTGDGYSCLDIDECVNQPCHPKATCKNTEGSYTCTCNTPFIGDGLTCKYICKSPSVEISNLGCITTIKEKAGFDVQKQNCKDMGMRLVEDFGKDNLEVLYNAAGRDTAWVGIWNDTWISGSATLPSDLWLSGQPDGDTQYCAHFDVGARLRDNPCGEDRIALCQLLY